MNEMLKGVFAAALTPMHADLSCHSEELAEHCQNLLARGCHGVVLFGTTGEGLSFSLDEKEKALKKTMQHGLDPKKVIVAVSYCAIADAVRLGAMAADLGCGAILMAPPFFYKKVDTAGVIDFYRSVIKQINHPSLKVILYHIPQFTGIPLSPEIIKGLRDNAEIVGIKESEGNLDYMREILSSFPGFKLFAGKEPLIPQAVALGGVGTISGLANAFPELIRSLYDSPTSKSQEKIEQLFQILKNYPLIPAIKSMVCQQKGKAWQLLRPPLTPLNDEQSLLLKKELETIS